MSDVKSGRFFVAEFFVTAAAASIRSWWKSKLLFFGFPSMSTNSFYFIILMIGQVGREPEIFWFLFNFSLKCSSFVEHLATALDNANFLPRK